MKARERFFFAFFIVFLIAPSLFMTFFQRKPPWAPRFAYHLYEAGNLFPRGVSQIPLFYLEMQTEKNESWTALDEHEYFPISKGLGYRTRFSRFVEIYLMQDGPIADVVGKVLADWFYRRHHELHPSQPSPVSFRILRAFYRVGSQTGRRSWAQPPIDSFLENDIEVAYANARA